jgi:hypothetical protein
MIEERHSPSATKGFGSHEKALFTAGVQNFDTFVFFHDASLSLKYAQA